MASGFERRANARQATRSQEEYVSVGDAWHRTYWAGRFGVSEEELLRAISRGGSRVAAIQRQLSLLKLENRRSD